MASVPIPVRFGWPICHFWGQACSHQVALTQIALRSAWVMNPWLLLQAAEDRRAAQAAQKPVRRKTIDAAQPVAGGASKRPPRRVPSMPAPMPEARTDLPN